MGWLVQAQDKAGADVSVLRVFVDALPDIPSHRRAPIFERLMAVLGWQRLWLFLALVCEAPPGQEDTNKPNTAGYKQRRSPKVACALELANSCPLSALLAAYTDCLSYLSVLASIKCKCNIYLERS